MVACAHIFALPWFCSLGWLAACGGGGDGAAAPSPAAASPDPFTDVDRTASAAFAAQGISGMGLAIYDAQGVKRFEKMYGTFAADQRVAIASVVEDGGGPDYRCAWSTRAF